MWFIFNTKFSVAFPPILFSLHICTKKNIYVYYELCINWCFAKVWNFIRFWKGRKKTILLCWFIQQNTTISNAQNTGIHFSWTVTLVLQHAIIDSFYVNFWLVCGMAIRFSHLLLLFNVFYYCWEDCLLSRKEQWTLGSNFSSKSSSTPY